MTVQTCNGFIDLQNYLIIIKFLQLQKNQWSNGLFKAYQYKWFLPSLTIVFFKLNKPITFNLSSDDMFLSYLLSLLLYIQLLSPMTRCGFASISRMFVVPFYFICMLDEYTDSFEVSVNQTHAKKPQHKTHWPCLWRNSFSYHLWLVKMNATIKDIKARLPTAW